MQRCTERQKPLLMGCIWEQRHAGRSVLSRRCRTALGPFRVDVVLSDSSTACRRWLRALRSPSHPPPDVSPLGYVQSPASLTGL